MDREDIDLLKEFIVPHLAMTFFKFKSKISGYLKRNNFRVTAEQFILLKILTQFKEISQQEFAEMIFKDKSNLSRMLEDLEKKGYLKRRLDLKGKRVVKKLCITQKGRQVVEEVIPIIRNLHSIGLDGICQVELDTLKNVLAKIRKNLDIDF